MTKKPTYEELEKKVRELEQAELGRKQAEEALKESENKLNIIFESAPDTYYLNNFNGVFTDGNRAAEKLLGYPKEELIGKNFVDAGILSMDQVEKALNALAENIKGKPTGPEEYTLKRKDGTNIDVEILTHPVKIGGENRVLGIARDITERKQAEEKVRESEANLQEAQRIANMGRWNLDLTSKVLQWSPTIFEIFEIDPEKFGASYEAFLETIHPDDRERVNQAYSDSLKHQKPYNIEHRLLMKNGRIKWVNEICRTDYDTDGQAIQSMGIVQEITERKQAEEALQESEKKYRLIFNNAPLGILHFNEKGIIVSCNDKFIEIIGSSREKLLDLDMFNLPDERVVSAVKMSLGGNLSFYEGDYHSVTSEKVTTARMLFAPIVSKNKNISGGVGIIEDITERKKAEEALRENEQLMSSVFESIQDGISVLNTDLSIRHVNGIMKKWYSENLPLEGKKCFECYHNADTPCNPCPSLRCLESGKTEMDIVPGLSDSGIEWIELYSYPIRHAGTKKITGIVEFVRNITDRKQLETQLHQARKMESIGTLAGGIAHDFNNLLYMITGNAELALDDIPEWNPAHDNLKEIKAAGMRAAGIVKQLLSFSRKIDQELKPIGAITVIKDALKFLRSMIPATIQINMHLPDTDVSILADPIQINQVLMNVCTNASHAMEKTGGNLTINVEKEILTQDAAVIYPGLTAGDYLKIAVTDTGPGIDPKIIDRIFDPYFTTKEIGKGSGMGLAVVAGIIKNHSGAITVDSQPGEGTTFTMLFPVVFEKPEVETKTTDELLPGNESILFVDDEEAIVNMIGQILERLGYTVETRRNPVDALALFKSKPDTFDLVITDMTMPQMTGAMLSEKLKNIRPDIPVIICTGHSSLINEEKAKELGIAAFVMKPIFKKEIAKTIRQVLEVNIEK